MHNLIDANILDIGGGPSGPRSKKRTSKGPNERKSIMSVNVLYRTQATATGGRDGKA